MVLDVVQFILGLGPTVMLPIVITIIGMAFGQGFKKAFRSGVTIGVGFVGINLVIGLLGELDNNYIEILNRNLIEILELH